MRRSESLILEVAAQEHTIKHLLDANKLLSDRESDLQQEIGRLREELMVANQRFVESEESLWLSEAYRDLYVEAASLPPFDKAPMSCPYCGSENLSTEFCEYLSPNKKRDCAREGWPAHLRHECLECGALIAKTKTLEASK